MRLVSFVPPDGAPRAGALLGDTVVDLAVAAPLVIEEAEGLRWDMASLLRADQNEVNLESAADILAAVAHLLGGEPAASEAEWPGAEPADFAGSFSIGGAALLLPISQVRLLAPLPRPASLRVYESFEEHAIAVRTLRGAALPEAWYRGPMFSFANHSAIFGPDEAVPMPRGAMLDYALGLACVIGRQARDLLPEEAPAVIAGYTLVNAWVDRDAEENEQALGHGPAKSRDFATSLGPWLVTPDELELYADDDGRLNLVLTGRVNGIERCRAVSGNQFYSFAELIAHASRGVTLYPGDVIASGAVGGGSLLESGGGYGPWLERDDVVELEATALGVLRNVIT